MGVVRWRFIYSRIKGEGSSRIVASSQISVQQIGFCRFNASQATFYSLPHQKVNKAPLNEIEDMPTPNFRKAISH